MAFVHQEDSGLRQSQRTRGAKSSDARRQRTRRALLQAVEEAVVADPGDLTVSAVVKRAGISRSAFYANFSSLADLAESLMIEAMEGAADVMNRRLPEAGTEVTIRATFEAMRVHFTEHRGLYRAILTLPGSASAFRGAVDTLASINMEYMSQLRVPEGIDARTVAKAIAWSHYGVYDAWLRGDLETDGELLVETLFELLPPWFRDNTTV